VSNLYREHILDHYRHPRNQGTLADATISYELDNPVCGDVVRIDVQLKDGRVSITLGPVRAKCALLSLRVLQEGLTHLEEDSGG
jgi:NifU-like protein involved in Fe-S cluster formation